MTFVWFCIGIVVGGLFGTVIGYGLGMRSAVRQFRADRTAKYPVVSDDQSGEKL